MAERPAMGSAILKSCICFFASGNYQFVWPLPINNNYSFRRYYFKRWYGNIAVDAAGGPAR